MWLTKLSWPGLVLRAKSLDQGTRERLKSRGTGLTQSFSLSLSLFGNSISGSLPARIQLSSEQLEKSPWINCELKPVFPTRLSRQLVTKSKLFGFICRKKYLQQTDWLMRTHGRQFRSLLLRHSPNHIALLSDQNNKYIYLYHQGFQRTLFLPNSFNV